MQSATILDVLPAQFPHLCRVNAFPAGEHWHEVFRIHGG